jgi:hypothetical protein
MDQANATALPNWSIYNRDQLKYRRIFGARFYHLCCGTAEQSFWERAESLAESGWFWAVLGLAFTLA